MKLIDADELKKEVQRLIANAPTIDICKDCDCRRVAIEALKAEPKTCEWITNKDGYSKCSECGFSFGCIVCPHEETDFCPNCGADMRGEEE